MNFKKDFFIALIVGEICAWFILIVLKNAGIFLGFEKWFWILPIIIPILSASGLFLAFWASKFFPSLFQLAKFILIGILNTLIDFGILNFFSFVFKIYSGWLLAIFNVISFIVANTNSYFWNKFWTFEKRGKSVSEFFRFFAVSVIGMFLSTGVLLFFSDLIGPSFGWSLGVWENFSKLISSFVYLVWNFIGYKFFVFGKEKTPITSKNV